MRPRGRWRIPVLVKREHAPMLGNRRRLDAGQSGVPLNEPCWSGRHPNKALEHQAVERALPSHGRGRRFDPCIAHHFSQMVSAVKGASAPFSPLLRPGTEPERWPPAGGNLGSRFAIRSAHLQCDPGRSAARLSAPSALDVPLEPPSREIALRAGHCPTPLNVRGRSSPPRLERTTFRTDAWIEFGIGGQKAVKVDGRCRQTTTGVSDDQ